LRLEPAYEYQTEIKHYLTVKGKTKQRVFPKRDQFVPELAYSSECILRNREPEPSGEEGLADVRIIRALRALSESGSPVKLEPFNRVKRPSMVLEMRRTPIKKPPKLVHAKTASGES